MTWTGVPSGASSVSILAINPGGTKLLGTRTDNDVESPWAWTLAGGNTTLAGVMLYGSKVSSQAAVAVYPPVTTSSGVFTVWNGSVSRTFTWLTGRSALLVLAVSPNGDCAVLAGLTGSTWSFCVVSGILSRLASNTSVSVRDIAAPSGYGQNLDIFSVSNSGLVYGSITETSSNVKRAFYSNTSGAVTTISDPAYSTSMVYGVGDSLGGDSLGYYINSDIPQVRTFSITDGALNITPTYGGYVIRRVGNALYGAVFDASSRSIASRYNGTWLQYSWDGTAPFSQCVAGYGDVALVSGYADESVGNTRFRFYTDATTYSELPLPEGQPENASSYGEVFSEDLTALVITCVCVDPETEEETSATYLWTAADGYMPLKASGAIAAPLTSTATISANLKIGVKFSASLSGVSEIAAVFPGGPAVFDASLGAASSVLAGLSTGIIMSASLAAQSSIEASFPADFALSSALAAQQILASELTTGIRFTSSLAAMSALSGALYIPLKATVYSDSSCAAALSTSIRCSSTTWSIASANALLCAEIRLGATLIAKNKLAARVQMKPRIAREFSTYSNTSAQYVRSRQENFFVWGKRA